MIVSNGRRKQEIFNGSLLSGSCSERFVPAQWPYQENSVPRGGIVPRPHRSCLVQTSSEPAQRATPPSDGVAFHHADDKVPHRGLDPVVGLAR